MKISIITVTYNSENTIASTIESVLQQDYDSFEHIIIDGGSKDNTINIVEKYEPCYKGRLKWISEKDNGIYDAMNKGIAMATGDIIGILNSDDYYTSTDILTTITETFRHSNVDAIYGDVHYVKEENHKKCVRYYSSKKFSPMWLRFGFMPAHPSFYCKREIYRKHGLYRTDYKIGSDYEMMVRLFLKSQIKAKYIYKDFVTMRTGGVSNHNLRSRLTLLKEDVKACRDNDIYTNIFFVSFKLIYKVFEFKM